MKPARTGPKDRSAPERSCVVTRAAKEPDDLIRFVAGPDGMIVPDLRRKLPGRGAWTSVSAAVVAEAVKRKAFERALKTKVTVPADLPVMVDALMLRDALQALAMANKAGLVTAGFAKVESQIDAGRCAAVIEASDGAEDGRRKIGQALTRAAFAREGSGGTRREVPVVTIFTAADLELALGRAHVIHAALAPGPAAEGFLSRWRRLVRYRTNDAGATGSDHAATTGAMAASDDKDEQTSEPAGPRAE